jgi:hypothetical protein
MHRCPVGQVNPYSARLALNERVLGLQPAFVKGDHRVRAE